MWNITVGGIISNIRQQHKELMRATAINIHRHIVLDSPVDTGTYRNNHHISFNTPDPRYKLNDGGVNEVVAFFGGDQQTLLRNADLTNVQTIYIQNNVPYAEYLEYGTDKMPALNIYSRGIQIGIASMRR